MEYKRSDLATDGSQEPTAAYTRERPVVSGGLLVDLVPRARRIAVRVAMAAVLSIAAGMFLIRISQEVRAPFTVLPPQGGIGALAPAVTMVDLTFAKPGDDVSEGQPIMRVRSPELVRLLASADDTRGAYRLFVTEIAPGYGARIASLRASITSLRRERKVLAAIQSQHEAGHRARELQAQREVVDKRKTYEQGQELIRSGWISRDDLRARALELQRAEADLEDFRAESRQQYGRITVEEFQVDASVRAAEREIAAIQAESASTEARIKREEESARQVRDAALVQHARVDGEMIVLTAPRSGKLSFRAEMGETVEPNRPLFHIDPSVGAWRVKIETTQDEVARLSSPLQVRLRFSSFAYLRYGEITARLTSISPDPLDAGKRIILADLPQMLPFRTDGGMSGTARLIGKRRTAAQIVMERLSR